MAAGIPHFCTFRSATGSWCWESRDHKGSHVDASGRIMQEGKIPKWTIDGVRYTAPDAIRLAADSHPDNRLSDLLIDVAGFLDRKEE